MSRWCTSNYTDWLLDCSLCWQHCWCPYKTSQICKPISPVLPSAPNNGCLIAHKKKRGDGMKAFIYEKTYGDGPLQAAVCPHVLSDGTGSQTDDGRLFFPLRPILGQAPLNTAWLWLLCLLSNRTMTCFLCTWPVSNKQWAKWNYLTCSHCSVCPGSPICSVLFVKRRTVFFPWDSHSLC